MTRTCLITGATGAVGPVVIEEFQRGGYRVRALARRKPAALSPEIEFIEGDVTDESVIQRAVEGVDVVVHLASLLHVFAPSAELAPEYERVNVTGTERLIAHCVRAGVKRVVYFSTIAVYGYAQSRVLVESETPQPDTFYGRTKLAAESAVLQSGIGVVLRMAAIYGSRMKGNYLRLVRAIDKGMFVRIGPAANHRALILDRDAARAAFLAAEHPAAVGEIFNVSDGQSPTLSDILVNIVSAVGRKPVRMQVPSWLFRLVGRIGDVVTKITRRNLPINSAVVEKYTEDVVVDSSKIQRVLGFSPSYNQEEGWRDAVSGMRAAGLLSRR